MDTYGLCNKMKYQTSRKLLERIATAYKGGSNMRLQLFEHNQAAFDAALEMLEATGKAAVVHPTGTGKSYIGFKLCEQFSEKTICWLSPSEYIYKTQLANLKEDSDGWQPENVKFFTYAKLMLMNDSALSAIKPDYIILDEFHRCGAEMWGEGVDRLLEMYPNAPLLGLTATAIRYLDNQRNMVNELFDGNIASEMTLGEAIVRGILNPPKYVLSVFAYQEDYKRLESRVRHTKSKATRDQAEQYLEALRRALEKADGMDVIFDKHITDRTGKYIVFCSNIDHLREMQRNVAAWFNRIDKEPHIYTAYSLDSATEQEFERFKQDESDHLKLLFCIDMLNEGVHVENISGVILFRPTVSPIIYKQQIGRALSASKTKDPIIFDIVNNIENLYAIGTIQQEMQVAISYYRSHGMDSYIVNDRFELIDEVEGDIQSIGYKEVYNIDGKVSAKEWIKQPIKGISVEAKPTFSSALSVKEGNNCNTKINRNALGCYSNMGNNVDQNQQKVAIFSSCDSSNANGLSIMPDNYERVMTLFAARRLVGKNWMNWADEYLAPNENHPKWNEFVNDSIVYSLFESKCNQASLRQIEFKGKKWNIYNEFFWMSKDEILQLASDQQFDECYNDVRTAKDRFVYQKLQSITLSPEAQVVLDKANEIVRSTFPFRELFNGSNPEYQIMNWDCGWYQIKALAKEYGKNQLDEFNVLYKALADKMRPMVFALGFLK